MGRGPARPAGAGEVVGSPRGSRQGDPGGHPRSLDPAPERRALTRHRPAADEGGVAGVDQPVRIWLADLTYTQAGINADVIPAAVGYIAAFARHRFGERVQTRIFKYPETLAEALEADGGLPHIAGFSNYCWNRTLGAAFARLLKSMSPDTVVVMGGPNYPEEAEAQTRWLAAHADVADYYIPHEGEQAFASVIQAFLDARGAPAAMERRIDGVHRLGDAGGAWLPAPLERIRDFEQIPSPYLDGTLDSFFDGRLAPILQTNRGCPFQCTFCVEGGDYYRRVNKKPGDRVEQELRYMADKVAQTRKRAGRNDLYIADSNFGMFKEDLRTCEVLAETRAGLNWPDYINVSTGKNNKKRVLEASSLIDGALRLSGAVQSLDPEVLDNVKRSNISAEEILGLALDAEGIGANSYSEIILGLPGDTFEKHCATLRSIVDAGFSKVVVYQLSMLDGADLATEASREEFGIRTRFRLYPRCLGQYSVRDVTLCPAEIEEICVELAGLEFADYLRARRLGLCTVIFYNDGLFLPLLRLLEKVGISRFDWLWRIFEAEAVYPPGLSRLMTGFVEETAGELFDSRQHAEAFLAAPGNFAKFVSGELGYNLMFTYKARAWTEHFGTLCDLARQAAHGLLWDAGALDDRTEALLDESLAYSAGRYSQLFQTDPVRRIEQPMMFDLPRLAGRRGPEPLDSYGWGRSRQVVFELGDEQVETLQGFRDRLGLTPAAIGRMFSRTHVSRLARQVTVTDP